MMVLVAHTMGAAEDPWFASPVFAFLQRGGLGGVMLFFALSGFLLYLPWLRSEVEGKQAPSFAKYAARRCLRIMPAYYASVVILAVLRVVVAGRDPLPWDFLLFHFLFVPNLGSSLLTVYWSLQVEEFFYWALPLLHRLRGRVGFAVLLALSMLVSLAWGLGALAMPDESRSDWIANTPFFLPAFILGIGTAVLWQRRPRDPGAWKGVALATFLYVVLCPVAQLLEAEHAELKWAVALLMAPLASAVVLGVARGAAGFLAHPVARFVGGISFSLYLWHMVVLRNAPTPALIAHVFPLRLVYVTALTIPVAIFFYLVTERPFLLLRPRSSQGPSASGA